MVLERQPLAEHTTLGVGGRGRYVATCSNETELHEALQFAHKENLSIAILGGGSNTLVPDEGFQGLVIRVRVDGITFTEQGDRVLVVAGAGVSWDDLVSQTVERSLWGIENLIAIPGTVGGALVQNIGAYGAELSQVFEWAEVIALDSGEERRIEKVDAVFAYRTSVFKQNSKLLITRVALRLKKNGSPMLTYADLDNACLQGERLQTPSDIAAIVRKIREKKFPPKGSAGSFFKNPIVEHEMALRLIERYPGLRSIPTNEGRVKIHLAWILDHVLNLKGYTKGKARLFESQPLVLVAEPGASANEIDLFANEISARVKEATGLTIEREVETLRAR